MQTGGEISMRSLLYTALFFATVPSLWAQVVISEIMADPIPAGSISGGEYIELFNIGEASIAIAGWRIVDGTGRTQGVVPDDTPPIPPRGYLALAGDSSLFHPFPSLRDAPNVLLLERSSGLGLNNDGDDLVLVTVDGQIVDSLRYDDAWHLPDLGKTRGLSLERISATAPSTDRRNWSTSASTEGGTPGRPNSIAVPITVASGEIDVTPRAIVPGRADFVRISWRLPMTTGRLRLAIHDLDGYRRRMLLDNEPAAPRGETIFDGRDDDGMLLGVGLYIARVEWVGEWGTVDAAQIGVVVGP